MKLAKHKSIKDCYQDYIAIMKKMSMNKNTSFYALFLMMLQKEFIEDPAHRVSAAGVGLFNRNIKLLVNKHFVYNGVHITNPLQYIGLFAHEANHHILGHLHMTDVYKNHEIANIAQDLYINSILQSSLGEHCLPGCTDNKEWELKWKPKLEKLQEDLHKGAITEKKFTKEYDSIPCRPILSHDFLEKYPEFTRENCIKNGSLWIYNRLMQDHKEIKIELSISMSEDSDSDSDEDSQPGEGKVPIQVKIAYNEDMDHPVKHEDWSEIQEGQTEGQKEFIKKQTEKIIRDVAEQVMKSQGTIPGHMKEIIDSIMNPPKPITNWVQQMRKWITTYGDFTRISRTRMKPHLVIPDGQRLKFAPDKHIVCLLDTSGSMSKRDLKECLAEIYNIKKVCGFKVDVAEMDTVVSAVWELKSLEYMNERLSTIGLSGRGGTELNLEWFNDKEQAKYSGGIYFTDGHVIKPNIKPKKPILVVTTSNGSKINWQGYKSIAIPEGYFDNK